MGCVVTSLSVLDRTSFGDSACHKAGGRRGSGGSWGGDPQRGKETEAPRVAASAQPLEVGGQLRAETRAGTGRAGPAERAGSGGLQACENLQTHKGKKSGLRLGIRWEQAKRTSEEMLGHCGLPACQAGGF